MSSDRTKRRRVQQEYENMLNEVNSLDNSFTVSDYQLDNTFSEPQYFSGQIDTQFLADCTDEDISPVISVQKTDLETKLSKWAVKHNITSRAVDDLLSILKNENLDLPKCSKTLLKTPSTKSYEFLKIAGGTYYHFGIVKKLEIFQAHNLIDETDTIRLSIAMDGLPISKSSKKQFWPILGSSNVINNNIPFLIGLFYSEVSKPTCFDQFLNPLVSELKELLGSGIYILDRHYSIVIHTIIADAPARNLLKFSVGFNAYHGCDRCVTKGKWLGRVIFPSLDSPLRTDADFALQSDKSHHVGVSPLLALNVGLVAKVPLDYMHLVCLGVVKKLLKCWRKGPLQFRLGRRDIDEISSRLVGFRKYAPKEFNRKPRTLFELDFWKATEFRSFLLYYGPVVLKGILNPKKYDHFLMLSVSLRILLSENREWYSNARNILREFVKQVSILYSSEFLVYNVHSLIHIADDADLYGSLDCISAFKYENYMQTLKKMVRSKNYELSQVVRRVAEHDTVFLSNSSAPKHISTKIDKGNSTFLLKNGDIVRLVAIWEKTVDVKIFKTKAEFFETPCKSSLLSIYLVSQLSNSINCCCRSSLRYKLMLLPLPNTHDQKFVCIPLCGQDTDMLMPV